MIKRARYLLLGLAGVLAAGFFLGGAAGARPAPAPAPAGAPPATPIATATPTPPPMSTVSPACMPAWHTFPSPNYGPIRALAATGPTDVWAVTASTILHWDGATWAPTPTPPSAPTPTPTPPGPSNFVYEQHYYGLAAAALNDVWAVGQVVEIHGYDEPSAFVSHWDGQTWTVVYAGQPAARAQRPGDAIIDDVFYAVAVVGPHEVWAVGKRYNTGLQGTLAAHCTLTGCDHIGGTIDPQAGSQFAALYGVASSGGNDVWAVGTGPTNPALIAHWNGTAWSAVAAPAIGTLAGVNVLSPADAWAAGGGGILHWDGTAWTRSPSVEGAGGINARAPDDAWAVGQHIQHWDGTQWSLVAAPAASLVSVVALSASDVWAAGDGVERYSLAPIFTDVAEGAPFYANVEALACRGDVSGYTCGAPGEPCPGLYYRAGAGVTRGQLAKMIANAAGLAAVIPRTQQTFADVPPDQPFRLPVERLAGIGAIGGYTCGGPGEPCDAQNRPYFRPAAGATRGQIAKIVAAAATLTDPVPPAQQTFADVPPGHPFWLPVERLAARGVVGGYACGGPGEPCDAGNRPYFRPGAATTRGQMAKIAALAFFGGP